MIGEASYPAPACSRRSHPGASFSASSVPGLVWRAEQLGAGGVRTAGSTALRWKGQARGKELEVEEGAGEGEGRQGSAPRGAERETGCCFMLEVRAL